MRYALNDDEWRVIKPMLPNKPRGVPRDDDRRVLLVLQIVAPFAIFCGQVRNALHYKARAGSEFIF